MPQVIGLMLIGAGIYAGFKALSRVLSDAAQPSAEPEPAKAHVSEKDLGRLEWDEANQVYRPVGATRSGGPSA